MHPYNLTRDGLTVFAGGVVHTLHSDDTRWQAALDLLRQDKADELVDLMRPVVAVQKALDQGIGKSTGISIRNGLIYLNDGPITDGIDDYTIRQILDFNAQGLPIQPLVNFYNRLQANPSFRMRRDLLKFLDYGKLPITDDGSFLAYKRVRADFKDVHSGKVDYTPGNVVEVPRSQVDDDPNNTCSHGLHVCSYEYLAHFSGEKVLSVKIDPADVVSIPTDYNNTKMRVCKITVLEEIPEPDRQNVWDSPVVNLNRDPCGEEWTEDRSLIDDNDEKDAPTFTYKFEVGDKVVDRSGVIGLVERVDIYDPHYPYLVRTDLGLSWSHEADLEAHFDDGQSTGPAVPQRVVKLLDGSTVGVGDRVYVQSANRSGFVRDISLSGHTIHIEFEYHSGSSWYDYKSPVYGIRKA